MAIFTPGPAVGQVSGRVGGTVFSRNRGGAYMRNGSKPSIVRTDKALLYKSYFTAASQAWTALTSAEQLAWTVWSRTQSKVNRLGRSIQLTGQAQYIGLSARLLAMGVSLVATPPTTAAPAPVTPGKFTVDAGAGDTELEFTTTPLPAGVHLWIRGAKVNSSGINNVENLLTEVLISDAAATSPVDLESDLIDSFGALQVGATYVLQIRTCDEATGLVSGAFYVRTVCVST
jgi:hypothetical protein